MILIATRRSIGTWVPRNTAPIPPLPSTPSRRYLPSSTWPSSCTAVGGGGLVTAAGRAPRSEPHAVLDPERQPVPTEVRGAGEADHREHRGVDDGEHRRTTGRGDGHRALALGHDFVALDQRAHPPMLRPRLGPVKPGSCR